jgi:phosphatidylglycerol---prolipoprotein diacylglyceryl transferase
MVLFVYETIRHLNLGFITVPTYAVFANLAFFSAAIFIFYMVRKEKLDINTAIFVLLSALAGLLIGAKIFYYFGPWSWQHDWSFTFRLMRTLQVWGSGLVFYGGFIGACVGMYLYAKIRKVTILPYVDLIALSIGIAAGLSRVGCWFAGCCYGTPTNVPWAILRNGVAIHPTQLYFVAAGVFVFIIAWYAHKRSQYAGYTAIVSVFWYSFTRFFIEFFRADPRYFTLTASQWISIVLILITVFLYFWCKKKHLDLKAHDAHATSRAQPKLARKKAVVKKRKTSRN